MDQHLAGGWRFQPGDKSEYGRLARSAGAKYGEYLTGPDVEADVPDRDDVAERLGKPDAADQRRAHRWLRSRAIRNAIGTEATRISMSAGAAAWAKNASSEADQIAVERVLNPSGPRISVAGNSFIVTRKTSAAPIRSPARISGAVTLSITRHRPLPRHLAASSTLGFTCSRDALTAPSAAGKEEDHVGEYQKPVGLVNGPGEPHAEEDQGQGHHDARQGVSHVAGTLD